MKTTTLITALLLYSIGFGQTAKEWINKLIKLDDTDLVYFKGDNGLTGVTNSMTGDVVIKPVFKQLYRYKNKFIIYQMGNFVEMTDNQGKLIFTQAQSFASIWPVDYNEGKDRFIVSKNGKFGVVDIDLLVLVPYKYSILRPVERDPNYFTAELIKGFYCLVNGKNEYYMSFETFLSAKICEKESYDCPLSKDFIYIKGEDKSYVFSKTKNKFIFQIDTDGNTPDISLISNDLIFQSCENQKYDLEPFEVYSITKDKIVCRGNGKFASLDEPFLKVTDKNGDGVNQDDFYHLDLNKRVYGDEITPIKKEDGSKSGFYFEVDNLKNDKGERYKYYKIIDVTLKEMSIGAPDDMWYRLIGQDNVVVVHGNRFSYERTNVGLTMLSAFAGQNQSYSDDVKGSFFQIKNFSTNKSISMHSEYYKAGIDPYKLSFRSIEPNGDVIFFYGRKFVKVNSSTGFYEILKDL